MSSGEKFVEAMLCVVERERRDRKSRAAKTGGSHSDKQGSRRLAARGQVAEAFANQLSSRKRINVHGASNYTAEQVEDEQQRGPAGSGTYESAPQGSDKEGWRRGGDSNPRHPF